MRDRLYAQDFSDLEFVAAVLDGGAGVRSSSRARRHPDRGGDPLDGLVDMFDLGIVLAVAFLLAALQSLDLTQLLTDRTSRSCARRPRAQTIVVKEGDRAAHREA